MAGQMARVSGLVCRAVAGRTAAVSTGRPYATEARPEDYGYFPDPVEDATGLQKKLLLARLAGDDRFHTIPLSRSKAEELLGRKIAVSVLHPASEISFRLQSTSTASFHHSTAPSEIWKQGYEAKVYKRGPGTQDHPNLVPVHLKNRLIGCVCEPDAQHIVWFWVRRGEKTRCECGHWFEAVDADPDSM